MTLEVSFAQYLHFPRITTSDLLFGDLLHCVPQIGFPSSEKELEYLARRMYPGPPLSTPLSTPFYKNSTKIE